MGDQGLATDDWIGKPIRVFLADAQSFFRYGLSLLLKQEPGFQLCGEAASAEEMLSALPEAKADLILIDFALNPAHGMKLIEQLGREYSGLIILVLSSRDEEKYALAALRSGASGYVMKTEPWEVVQGAIRKVLKGGLYVSARYGEKLIYKVTRPGVDLESALLAKLSPREKQVLELIGQSMSSRQIALQLGLSVKTVESFRLRLKEKLGFGLSGELVRFAIELSELRSQRSALWPAPPAKGRRLSRE